MGMHTPNILTDSEQVSAYLNNKRVKVPDTGTRFGRLTFTGEIGVTIRPPRTDGGNTSRVPYYRCACDCGSEPRFFLATHLGKSVLSCGCYQREMTSIRKKSEGTKYAKSVKQYPLYKIWNALKARCSNANDKKYHRYGGRGIFVCDEWKDFAAFEKWCFANGYVEHGELTLDRKNNDGPYSPDNCRFATRKQQQRNQSVTIMCTAWGETKPFREWLEDPRVGVKSLSCFWHRTRVTGLSDQEALSRPPNSWKQVHRK